VRSADTRSRAIRSYAEAPWLKEALAEICFHEIGARKLDAERAA
jgi:hypothetical protein